MIIINKKKRRKNMIYRCCSDELRNLKSSGENFAMQETDFPLDTDLKSMNNGFIQR